MNPGLAPRRHLPRRTSPGIYPLAIMQKWSDLPEVIREAMAPLASETPLLSGCRAAYLDLGANVGQRLEILYGHARYQGIIGTWFRNISRADVCALAFEPNPKWFALLRNQTAQYRRQGHRVHFFPAAIAANNSQAAFWRDRRKNAPREWGATLLPALHREDSVVVPTVSLSWLLMWHVPHSIRRIYATMDIEGGEWESLPPTIERGQICATLDALQIEVHATKLLQSSQGSEAATQAARARIERLQRLLRTLVPGPECRTQVVAMGGLDEFIEGRRSRAEMAARQNASRRADGGS